jgi:citrate lyase subunit beta/citryl-CoA lyase
MIQEFGACVFDVTLDCEDGAPVGGEIDQANMVAALANTARADTKIGALTPRVGVRVHAVDHSAFASDVDVFVSRCAAALSYVMVPKVESLAQIQQAVAAIDAATPVAAARLPVHVLIESPAAVHQAFDIASHPRVESVSFGLMDFVSAHGGAIPSSAMGVRSFDDTDALDQFHHPLVVRAKLDIASACHAHGKVPSHCVVTEFRDLKRLHNAARMASQALGYTRMWSIHPDQIRPILAAFSPDASEIEAAANVLYRAAAQDWAPISLAGTLHDRASYRYFWHVLERAHQTGCTVPDAMQAYFPNIVH